MGNTRNKKRHTRKFSYYQKRQKKNKENVARSPAIIDGAASQAFTGTGSSSISTNKAGSTQTTCCLDESMVRQNSGLSEISSSQESHGFYESGLGYSMVPHAESVLDTHRYEGLDPSLVTYSNHAQNMVSMGQAISSSLETLSNKKTEISLYRESHDLEEDALVSWTTSDVLDRVADLRFNIDVDSLGHSSMNMVADELAKPVTLNSYRNREKHDLSKDCSSDTLSALDVYGGYDDDGYSKVRSDSDRMQFDCREKELLDSSTVCAVATEPIVSTDSSRCELSDCNDDVPVEDIVSSDEDKNHGVAVDGRRIVDLSFLWRQLHEKIGDHKCPFNSLKLEKYVDRGLRTQLFINCQQCNLIDSIWTDREDDTIMGVNEGAICGTITSGIGCSTLREALAAMAIPFMSDTTYRKYRNRLYKSFLNVSKEEMKKAAEKEKAFAIAQGNVVNGVVCIRVVADGAWAKRSYAGGKHDSLSGVAVIIGYETGLVLFVGVRNKYCDVETKAERFGREVPKHDCFKNWGRDQSSNAMEKDIIVEGFNCSVEMHGLIYKVLIADGDASTYQAIRDANPYAAYGLIVAKIECNNHLFRNMCKKFRNASLIAIPRVVSAKLSTTVTTFRASVEKAGLEIRQTIQQARDLRVSEDVSDDEKCHRLETDIFTIFEHVFGNHSACGSLPFACEPKKDDKNLIADLHLSGLYSAVYEAVRYLSAHAYSLLQNVTNNIAEAFNSIVNKLNAGKRTNQCARNSYELRSYAAVIQHNNQSVLSQIHVGLGKTVPSSILVFEKDKKHRVNVTKTARHAEGGKRYHRRATGTDKDYGPESQQPDLPYNTYEMLKEKHMHNLKSNQEKRGQIERETQSQSDSELWHTLRLDIITASNFGKICRMQKTTSCSEMVKSIRYPKVVNTEPVRFGKENEPAAKIALERELDIQVDPCGLFIDAEIPYLGASPDGLIEPDGIVEIKCPFSARDRPVEEAIAQLPKLRAIFDKNNKDCMSMTHVYYYQVQGQLHVTMRNYCIFVLWTSVDLKYVIVKRDDHFWRSKMEPFLSRFYMECLLPEIVDSRVNRKMKIRDPEYILKAKAEMEHRKNMKVNAKRVTGADSHESTQKRMKPCESDGNSEIVIDEQVVADQVVVRENYPDANWVTIELDDDADYNVAEMIETIEVARRNIDINAVIVDIQGYRNLLNDSSIDAFLEIVKENSVFSDINPACYMGYYPCIQPCRLWKPDMQIIGGNTFRHWCCVYYDGARINVYDSLSRVDYEIFHPEEKRYIERRYGHVIEEHSYNVHIKRVTRQPDEFSCGVYAAAFATTIALGQNPEKIVYSRDANEMRAHLMVIIRNRKLSPFPIDQLQVP